MKGKGAVVTQLTLSFYVITFSINSWLIEGSATIKKRCDRVPQLSMFLRMLFICILSKFWFKWKASWGCQFSLSHNIIHLLILTLGFSKLPFAMGTPEFHAQGPWQMPCENGTPRNHGYTYYTHLLCSGSDFIVSSEFTYKTQIQVLKFLKFQGSNSTALN